MKKYRVTGFGSFADMNKYIRKNKIKTPSYGYNKKQKHFFEYEM